MPKIRFLPFLIALAALPAAADWTQFRGPGGSGSAPGADPPVEWSREKNVAWAVDLPGEGLSQPIVVGDRVYVTGDSGPENERLHVVCYDAATGRQRWHRQFWATGRTAVQGDMRVATPTPVATADRVYALFSSNDLICLDADGDPVWYRGLMLDYPNATNSLGMASSLALADGSLVVQLETEDASLALGVDAATGDNRWKIDRPRKANWSSPVPLKGQDGRRDLVLLQGANGLTAVDPATGRTAWEFAGGGSSMSSVATADGLVFVPSGGVTAIKPPASVGEPEKIWSAPKLNCSYVSPVIHRGKVYTINGSAVLTCGDERTGEVEWQVRLGDGPYWGTPVAAGDRLYCPSRSGVVKVVDVSGAKGEIVASNDVGEPLGGPPAVDGNALYFRTDTKLWKVAAP